MERGRLRHKPTNTFYRVEIEREEDGRWIADVIDLPGVMAYGDTREAAIRRASALAARVLHDRAEYGEFDYPDERHLSHVHA